MDKIGADKTSASGDYDTFHRDLTEVGKGIFIAD